MYQNTCILFVGSGQAWMVSYKYKKKQEEYELILIKIVKFFSQELIKAVQLVLTKLILYAFSGEYYIMLLYVVLVLTYTSIGDVDFEHESTP